MSFRNHRMIWKPRNVLTIGYRAAMEKVHRVDDAFVLNPHRSAHESIDTRIHDRLTRDETSKEVIGTSWPRTGSRMRCVSVPAWLGKDDDESHAMKWPFYFFRTGEEYMHPTSCAMMFIYRWARNRPGTDTCALSLSLCRISLPGSFS